MQISFEHEGMRNMFQKPTREGIVEYELGEIQRVAEKYCVKDVSHFADQICERVEAASLVVLDEDIWSRLANTDSYTIEKGNWDQVDACVTEENRGTGALRKWRKTKLKMEEGGVCAPIILKKEGYYELLSGNTRLMISRAFGIQPNVIVIDIDDLLSCA